MHDGSRVTDAVEYWRSRGELSGAVKIVRNREPERFRWRRAVGLVSASAGALRGRDRMRIEEPVREVILDLPDLSLKREVVIDARRVGVDLDRGEVLPGRTLGTLSLLARRAGVDLSRMARHMRLPSDLGAPIDVAAAIVVARTLGDHHKLKSQRLLLQLPDSEGPERPMQHHRFMSERADLERAMSRNFYSLASSILES